MSARHGQAKCNCCVIPQASVWNVLPNSGVVWSYDTGASTNDVASSGGTTFVVGTRSTTWTGSGGANASLWKLDATGTIVWGWDSGDQLVGVATDGTSAWVCGLRTNTWTGHTGNASIWKINSGGTVDWAYDTGAFVSDVDTDGTNAWGHGDRSSSKTVWKLNSSGSLSWSWDTSADAAFATRTIRVDGSGNAFLSANSSTAWTGSGGANAGAWELDSSGALVQSWYTSRRILDFATGGQIIAQANSGAYPWTTAEIDSAGNAVWTWDASSSSNVQVAGSYIWLGGGSRNILWQGSGGLFRSVWRLTTAGVFDWAWDAGSNSRKTHSDGTNVWVSGIRNNTWSRSA